MPSMKCYQCGKVKRCRMYIVRGPRAEYLCGPCARELGYMRPAIRERHLMGCPANDAEIPESQCRCTP